MLVVLNTNQIEPLKLTCQGFLTLGGTMPAAPRMNKKFEKIAFRILGKPDNYEDKETAKQEKIKKALDYQDIYIAR